MRRLLLALVVLPTWGIAQVQVHMERKDGVYFIPCRVNGLDLNFIFDTGASDVSISLAEASFMLKNGYMNTEDLGGTEYYQLANGVVEEGVIVNLKTVEIAGVTIANVRASVSKSMSAPLLFGSSALERFGQFSVDYKRNMLTLGGEIKHRGEPHSSSLTARAACTDVDGNTYPTIQIGHQVWMAENLRVTHYCNGDPIPTLRSDSLWSTTTVGAVSSYADNSTNDSIYGKLYNWFAASDARGLCPSGFQTPTDADWGKLEQYLGLSEVELQKSGMSRGAAKDVGGQLKNAALWDGDLIGSNESSFSALPAGCRLDLGIYYGFGSFAYFWTATESGSARAWYRILVATTGQVGREDGYKVARQTKRSGLSCRCLKK